MVERHAGRADPAVGRRQRAGRASGRRVSRPVAAGSERKQRSEVDQTRAPHHHPTADDRQGQHFGPAPPVALGRSPHPGRPGTLDRVDALDGVEVDTVQRFAQDAPQRRDWARACGVTAHAAGGGGGSSPCLARTTTTRDWESVAAPSTRERNCLPGWPDGRSRQSPGVIAGRDSRRHGDRRSSRPPLRSDPRPGTDADSEPSPFLPSRNLEYN